MVRLALAASVVLATSAMGRDAPPRKAVKTHHRWKCTFVGRMVYCDRVDHPLSPTRRETDAVSLFDRPAPSFPPLVAPPASFR
ncbi:MAG: hypothetical protein ACOZQL_34705 [Myxococcota bacterium]